MRFALRGGAIALALVLAVVAGWRIVVTSTADRLAAKEPQRALAWDPGNPAALLALAERQLTDGQAPAAAATARQLLRIEPLQAQAFAVLAEAASADAAALHELALRHAPRDLRTRAWLLGTQLAEGRYADALANIDVVLRISPAQGTRLFPLMVQLADNSVFADALAQTLSTQPAWRAELLSAVLTQGSQVAVDQVYTAVQRDGGLSSAEAGRWLDRLIAAGEWGEAYSRWVGTLTLTPGASLPVVYNGDFEAEPTGIGFDWRLRGAPGVLIERAGVAGARGTYAARVAFLGRRVPQIDFEQTLLLAAGRYRLHLRAHARDLRSDKGLEWAIACHGAAEPLAVSARLEGNFDWKAVATDFVVPSADCPAQRLWLRNPGADGAGKIVSGTLWFDDIAIDRIARQESIGGPPLKK